MVNKYIGVFNEESISFMKTDRLKERIEKLKKDDSNFFNKLPSPSKIKTSINYDSDFGKKIALLITNTDDKKYDFDKKNIEDIKATIQKIILNKDIFF